MRKNFVFIPMLIALLGAFMACRREPPVVKPFGMRTGNAFCSVTLASYTAIPGGARIVYRTFNDQDLMYIKIKYRLDSGKDTLIKASKYTDTLSISGFGNTATKNISLIAVDRYGNESKASDFDVVPGTPSFCDIAESLVTKSTYGGISLSLKNKRAENAVIKVEVLNGKAQWVPIRVDTVSDKDVKLSVRGLRPIPTQFKISIGDLCGNFSKPILATHTPFFEQELDRKKFRKIVLPTDLLVDGWGCKMENIWNGVVDWDSFNLCHSDEFDGFPQWFTFDLGATVKLSRYKYWQRLQEAYLYQHANMKSWEVWGRADTPKPDGSWDGWVKLLRCESRKPSKRPLGLVSKEDIAYAVKGEEFEFDVNIPPVRYIRIKVLSTFSGTRTIHIQQINFWSGDNTSRFDI